MFEKDGDELVNELGDDGTGIDVEDNAANFMAQAKKARTLAQVSLPQVRGNGPNGIFPGNFDHWTEKEDLYSQLFYEI